MAKTQDELKELKEEYENINKKIAELNKDELKQVTGGCLPIIFASAIRGILNKTSNLQGDSSQGYKEPPGSIEILREPLQIDSIWTPNYNDENGGVVYYKQEKKK